MRMTLSRRRATAASLVFVSCLGCAGPGPIARSSPEQLVREAGETSEIKIWLEGEDSEGPEPGFKRVIAALSPIMVKCQQQAGTYKLVVRTLRFTGPHEQAVANSPKPEFTHNAITEINCKAASGYLWGARVSYADHRFAQQSQKGVILLNLRTSFMTGPDWALYQTQQEPEWKERQAKLAAEAKLANDRFAEAERQRAEQKRLDDERERARQAQLVAARPSFRATLKSGVRVKWLEHFIESTKLPATGLVVELKRPLALIQVDIYHANGTTTTETRWIPIDELAQVD